MATTTDQAAEAVPDLQTGNDGVPRDSHSFQLLLRLGLLNIVALALLMVAWGNGLVELAFRSDSTHLVLVIAAVFIAGLGLVFWRVYDTSWEINRARRFNPAEPSFAADYVADVADKDAQSRQILASSLRLKLSQRITVVRHVANSLVFLGLIGTVIGFIIALSGVDPETVGDVDNVSAMVALLIQGMSTALMTTLVGAVLNIWLMANYQLLASGTVKLITTIIELGENRARA